MRAERLSSVSSPNTGTTACMTIGAGVEVRVHQVYGGAREADAVLEGLALGVETGERRQKRRVDVQDAVGKRVHERRAEQPHETGQADQLHVARAQVVDQDGFVGLAGGPALVVAHDRLDAGQSRALEAERVGAIRDDDGEARVEPSVADGVDDGLEVGPPARDEHSDVACHVSPLPAAVRYREPYTTPGSPSMIRPIRCTRVSPAPCSIAVTRDSSSAAQPTIMPIPMLKVRYMSSSGTLPARWRKRKTALGVQADVSTSAAVPGGRMRGRFSVMPPPVMCASPLTSPASRSGRTAGQ